MGYSQELVSTAGGADTQLHAIAHGARRRLLLELLEQVQQRDARLRIDDLVEDAESDSAAIDLRHRHLPKLDDHGYVDWTRDTGEVSRGPAFDEIEPLLTVLRDNPDRLPDGWL